MSKLLKDLNEEQIEAVTHTGTPLLIIAGAGTGKTTVITRKIAWLIENGLAKPEEILALTFTEKAADEMVGRVESLLPIGYTDLWISTFHSFCQRILNEHGLEIGISTEAPVIDQTAAWMMVYKNLDLFDLDYYRPIGNPSKFIHALLTHFSRAKDEAIGPQEYLEYAEKKRLDKDNPEFEEEGKRLSEIAGAYHTYNQLLRDEGKMDFGDLLMFTYKLFDERPQILSNLQRKFKYILVDEFQDTNWIQFALVKKLSIDGSTLTVVADDDQSIYKFRGASVSNVMEFLKDYPNSEKIVLTKNYRSVQPILDLAHKFIQNNNPNRLEASDRKLVKRLESQNNGKGNILLKQYNSVYDEARGVGEEIQSLVEDKGVSFSNIALLTRTNAQASTYVQLLESLGIPVIFHARTGLMRENIILDIIAWLRVLDNQSDSRSMYRVMRMPHMSLSGEDIMVVTSEAKKKQISYVSALKQLGRDRLSDEGNKWRSNVLDLISTYSRFIHSRKPSRLMYRFLEDTGYLRWIAKSAQSENPFNGERVLGVLRKFFDDVLTFESQENDPNLKEWLSFIELMQDSGSEGAVFSHEDNVDAVNVMTIHRAKGLEFDYVFIPSLVHLRFPSMRRKDPIELPDDLVKETIPEGDIHLEEERRLMYVALTRAKNSLYLSLAKDYGGKRAHKPSVFLNELEITLQESGDSKEHFTASLPVTVSTKKKLPIPKGFSFTALSTFKACPLQYKFSQILKIPTKGKAYFSFGKTMHRTLELFYKRMRQMNEPTQTSLFETSKREAFQVVAQKKEDTAIKSLRVPSLSDLLEIYNQSWLDDWYASSKQKDEFRAQGEAMLKKFYKQNEDFWSLPIALEKRVTFRLGEYLIRGAVDRIDEIPDGGVRIIDYKTGKPKRLEDLKREDKQQLLMYQIGVEEVMGLKPRELCFWYLEDGTQVSFEGTESDIIKLKEQLLSTINTIHESDFSPTPSKFVCSNCDYKEICEYRVL